MWKLTEFFLSNFNQIFKVLAGNLRTSSQATHKPWLRQDLLLELNLYPHSYTETKVKKIKNQQ